MLRLSPNHRARLRRRLLAVGQATSGALSFRGLTGGVYKAQEHIHRGVADPRLLAIPASWGRIAASQSELGRVLSDLLHLAVLRRAVLAIVARLPPRT